MGPQGACPERHSTALCSAREAKHALLVAVAWGYVSSNDIAIAYDRLDHAAATLFRMLHPRT